MVESLHIVRRTTRSLIVEWDPPKHPEGTILRYLLQWSGEDGLSHSGVVESQFTKYHIVLNPPTEGLISVSVQVENRAMKGPKTVLESYV